MTSMDGFYKHHCSARIAHNFFSFFFILYAIIHALYGVMLSTQE